MNPIFATNRVDISGWYAYREPPGQYVIWDGGANRDGKNTGLWNPTTGEPIQRDAEWLNKLPQMPISGNLDGDVFNVTAFPDLEILLNRIGRTTDNAVFFMRREDGSPLQFHEYATKAAEFLDGETTRFVRCRVLPDDKEAALEEFRLMGPEGMATDPEAFWVPSRSVYHVTNERPEQVYTHATIREIIIEEGEIQTVECWATPGTVMRFTPLYHGDEIPEHNVFKKREDLTLYCHQNIVVGYELP